MDLRPHFLGMAIAILLFPLAKAQAQELPPLPESLLNASGAVCMNVSMTGDVRGAYLLTSTGDSNADKDMVAWARQLHWPVAKPGEKLRDTWFPMPIAFGSAKPVAAPPTCSAPA